MEHFRAEISATINLYEVVKYHQNTQAKIENLMEVGLSPLSYPFMCVVNLLAENETELHPAFDYFKLAGEFGISDSQTDNLVYITYAFCFYEWSFYNQSVLNTDESRDIYLPIEQDNLKASNLVKLAVEELSQLLFLLELQEFNINDVEIVVNKLVKRNYQSTKTTYLKSYSDKTTSINNPLVIENALKSLIASTFQNLKNSVNPYVSRSLSDVKEPNYSKIKELISGIETPIEHHSAHSHFRKIVSEVCLSYLNVETILKSPTGSISAEQAQIIYSLLALFKIIDYELIDGHPDSASRVKYIRSLLFNTANIKSAKHLKKQINPFSRIYFRSLKN